MATTVAHLSDYQTAEAYREIFRSHDYLRHGIRLEDEACIFDVGANIGLFSLFANQVCRRPRIYAFEPMPVTFDVLLSPELVSYRLFAPAEIK